MQTSHTGAVHTMPCILSQANGDRTNACAHTRTKGTPVRYLGIYLYSSNKWIPAYTNPLPGPYFTVLAPDSSSPPMNARRRKEKNNFINAAVHKKVSSHRARPHAHLHESSGCACTSAQIHHRSYQPCVPRIDPQRTHTHASFPNLTPALVLPHLSTHPAHPKRVDIIHAF